MDGDFSRKSSVAEIRARFDAEVERFSNAVTGQTSTMDAELVLQLLTDAVAAAYPGSDRNAERTLLDIGCGGGNFTIRIVERLSPLRCTLIDLSRPMLERAVSRVREAGGEIAEALQGDVREMALPAQQYDIVVAAAVLHHLRTREEWHAVLETIYRSQRPGGSFWMFDLVRHESGAIQQVQRERYAAYLRGLGGSEYQERVFDYIAAEDSPESTGFILNALLRAGYRSVDVIHKNGPFAAVAGFV